MKLSVSVSLRFVFSLLIITWGFVASDGRCRWSQNRSLQREMSLYSFTYLGLSVARGHISISDTLTENGRSVTRIEACASSVSPTSFLFRIDNRYITTIDAKTGYPLTYEKIVEQSNFSEQTLILFDQEGGHIYCGNDHMTTIASETHNFFSTLYFLLNHTFRPHEVMHLPVFAAGQIWQVTTKPLKIERVVTKAGTYPAVLFEIEFQGSSSKPNQIMDTDVLTHRLISEGKKTHMWLSTSQDQTVVKGTYSLFPADLQMILTKYRKGSLNGH